MLGQRHQIKKYEVRFPIPQNGDSVYSLQNSGAKYIGNKMPRQIQNFSVCLGSVSAKKQLPKTQ